MIEFNNSMKFFITNLKACFKFLMWITYSLLSSKLVANFWMFQFSLIYVKMVNHYEIHIALQYLEYQLLKKNLLHLSLNILGKSSLNWWVSSIYWSLFTGSFWNVAQPYNLFTPQYLRYDGSLFLSESFIY